MRYFVSVNGRDHEVVLEERGGALRVRVDGRELDLDCRELDGADEVLATLGGRSRRLTLDGDASQVSVTLAGHAFDVRLEDERERAARAAERSDGRRGGIVQSVMPGVVVEVLVRRDQAVEKGQPLLILSAMKMQNEIAAPSAGVVAELHVKAGEAVRAGARLVTLTTA